ncbi:PH domain-containing protein [Streptomyces glaucosporus]|uniref:PH domain-containing protein n=1 Tax=Streptomyces glaucosporus TaxID=284044 RepID=A0ABN3IV32_9ACTN
MSRPAGGGTPGERPGAGNSAGIPAEAAAGTAAGSPAEGAAGTAVTAERWRGVERGLLRMRRTLLVAVLVPLALAAALVLGTAAGPAWAALAAVPLAVAVWGWRAIALNWASWRYAERADDLLIARGVVWRGLTVVPYGRMQLVEVTSGPLERRFGLARVQLHTAAATTDAHIPGLAPEEAERLRDRLTELGEARSAGL